MHELKIDGILIAKEGEEFETVSDFTAAFTDFLETRGWSFAGATDKPEE